MVVLDKPALLDSQNSKPGRASIVDWLVEKYGFAGLVHRLDFGTSGLMVAAKNPQAAQKLTDLLQAGKIDRGYLAMVLGQVLPKAKTGTYDSPIEDKEAKTHFKILERFPNATLVQVDLETGRKHQIRIHFSEAGHPLLGDHLYARKGSDRLFERPALHAYRLVVDGKVFAADLPLDFRLLLERLRAKRF